MPALGAARLSLSPDARRLAYVSGGSLYVRSISGGEPNVVYSGGGTGTPFWSPDGRSIAFASGGKLLTISLGGWAPVTLCEINTNVQGTWGPDGTILIGKIGDGIFRVSQKGGELVRVTKLDNERGETRHMMPQFMPGGRRFLYLAGTSKPGGGMLYAGSLDSEERLPIMPTDSTVMATDGYLVFGRGASILAQRFDPRTLQRLGEPFGIASNVANGPAVGAALAVAHFSASPKTLAYSAAGAPPTAIHVIQNWELLR
jgi:hypothetical protein